METCAYNSGYTGVSISVCLPELCPLFNGRVAASGVSFGYSCSAGS
ncbi:MAG TPA: hypothetical protein VFE53_21965 [Mucilaginibacter sp.]|nr:hypothetical protein [Mucilaginibacter sp.]